MSTMTGTFLVLGIPTSKHLEGSPKSDVSLQGVRTACCKVSIANGGEPLNNPLFETLIALGSTTAGFGCGEGSFLSMLWVFWSCCVGCSGRGGVEGLGSWTVGLLADLGRLLFGRYLEAQGTCDLLSKVFILYLAAVLINRISL